MRSARLSEGFLGRSFSHQLAGKWGHSPFPRYNNRGRLKTAKVGTAAAVTYTYNALGQRIKKTGTTRLFVYDPAGHLLGEYNSSGTMVQEFVWLNDTPVAVLTPKTGGIDLFYIHTDHLNTPRKITRPSDNKLRWRWDPDAFGNGTPNQNPQSLGAFVFNLRMPGQYFDAETGLHYNYFRDYDPQTGRYGQSDPIGLKGGINTFAYANGNPIGNVDPDGLVVRGRGCTNKGWASIQDAERKIRKELAKGCECTPDSQGSCIPCDIRPQLMRALDTSVVNCSFSTRVCGEAPRGGSSATIMRPAFDNPVGCGCVALTLYHELLHNAGLTEPQVGPLDRGCSDPSPHPRTPV